MKRSRIRKMLLSVSPIAAALLAACSPAERDSETLDARAVARVCLDDIVSHGKFVLADALDKGNYSVTVMDLSNELIDVVVVIPTVPTVDGPYWRCEVSHASRQTARIEYSLGGIEPVLVDLQTQNDKGWIGPLMESEFGDVLATEEFMLNDLVNP